MHKVAVIVGSLRKDSINKKLTRALEKLAYGRLEFDWVRIDDLPLYNHDKEHELTPEVKRFKSQVEAADAVLFVTPEHNRSIPAALKNAFDWGSRPRGENSWTGKVAAVIGASPGGLGSAVAQQHMRAIAIGHFTAILGAPEAFVSFKDGLIDDDGNITAEATKTFLQRFVDRFAKLIEAMAKTD